MRKKRRALPAVAILLFAFATPAEAQPRIAPDPDPGEMPVRRPSGPGLGAEPLYVGPPTVTPESILQVISGRSADVRSPMNLTGNSATTDALILGCANTAGKNGAYFKTEVNIQTRWTTRKIKVDIFAVPAGTAISDGRAVGGTYELDPFVVYTYENILGSLGYSGAAYVLIGIDSSVTNRTSYTLDIWANTYTATPGGGFFRTPLPVFTDASLLDTYYQYRFPNVRTTAGDRTNVGFFNPDTARTLVVEAHVHDYARSGWSPSATITLQPGEFRQVSLTTIYSDPMDQGEIRWDVRTKDISRFLVYTVRTDNLSNDGLLELPYRNTYSSWPY